MARRKVFSLRRRLYLLVSLCLLWIYGGIGRTTRYFGSSRMPNDTERTYTILTKGYASGRDSHLQIPDPGDGSPHPRTFAAILLVTTSPLPYLSESLSGLSTIPYLSEVYILCPEDIASGVRNSLRQTLSHIQNPGGIEFFITIWRHEWSEAESALRVASTMLSNDVLILSQDTPARIDPTFQRIMLSGPSSLPVPLGLRGSEISCETKYQGFLAARFVSPPLLLPSRLGATNQSYFELTSWQELGAHFAQVEGVGGVVPPEALENTNNCHDLDALETVAGDVECLSSESSKPNDLLVVLVAEGGDLPALSRLACKFKSRGTEVEIIAYGSLSGYINSPGEGCGAALTHIRDLQDLTLRQLLDHSKGVFLTLLEYRIPLEFLPRSNAWGVVIQIPRSDLSHCDWMTSLGIPELRNWHVPRVDITVITNDRPSSLRRLLRSLSNARYFGDKPNVRINIEQDADYETLDLVDHWNWEHGSVSIARRVIHAGLLPAVVESWYPHSNHSYGLILEDDVEVSPLFYGWVKMNLLRYRYGGSQNFSAQMFGISLYQPKVIETRQEGRAFFNPRTTFAANDVAEYTTPYLSQIPCSWGAVYFPEHWREFHSYLNVRFSEAVFDTDAVVVPDARSNRWSKSWKKYFIELAYLRGYVMVYPNYDNFVSFSTNHLEAGSHVKDISRESYAQKREMFRVPLMGLDGATRLLDLPRGALPAFGDLPVLDLFGQPASLVSLIRLGKKRQSELVPACELSSGNHIRPDFRDILCAPRMK